MASLLESVSFRDPARAREDIARLGPGIPEPVEARLKLLLESLPDPDEALHYLERFRREASGAFERVLRSPAALQYLLTVFSFSRFLSDALVRFPESMLQLAGSGHLYRVLSAEEYAERLLDFLGPESRGAPQALDLARFRRRQILRIVLRDA